VRALRFAHNPFFGFPHVALHPSTVTLQQIRQRRLTDSDAGLSSERSANKWRLKPKQFFHIKRLEIPPFFNAVGF
jgi:hypothetical protein